MLLSRLLALDDCHGRDLIDAVSPEDQADARFYPEHYRLLRLEQQATSRELATIWRLLPADRVHAGTALADLALTGCGQDADGRWCYRFACYNQSELRAGETVLVSDGDPIRGDVVIATLTAVAEAHVEVIAPEPIAYPMLIDRYLSGEALDRTIRGLHAWLGAPAEVRTLLYGSTPSSADPRAADIGPWISAWPGRPVRWDRRWPQRAATAGPGSCAACSRLPPGARAAGYRQDTPHCRPWCVPWWRGATGWPVRVDQSGGGYPGAVRRSPRGFSQIISAWARCATRTRSLNPWLREEARAAAGCARVGRHHQHPGRSGLHVHARWRVPC